MPEVSNEERSLIEKIRRLPPDKAAMVEDFVDFLDRRSDDRRLSLAATRLSQNAFRRVWDNPEDSIYDAL